MCRSLSWHMVRSFRLRGTGGGTREYEYTGADGHGGSEADTVTEAGNRDAGAVSDGTGGKTYGGSYSRTYGGSRIYPYCICDSHGDSGFYAVRYTGGYDHTGTSGRERHGSSYSYAGRVAGTDFDTDTFADGNSGV